ncbi:MAG: NUDIX domain-containing protein [Patescibacteria group bacterium]|nr:NUDIX domain-containing protein [Patescibacteria group bacterium]MDD4610737.1 NUDIX domain-containing protein [Patescibacteria group bacterium]
MPQERFKIAPACYLVLIKDGRILLSRRCNTGFHDGNYSMVSGHLEGDESFRQAMAREAMEEAGIIIDPNKLTIIHALHRAHTPDTDTERIDIFTTIDEWEGEIKNCEPDKCDHLDWFPLDELPENTISYVRQVIDCVQKNIFYSEHGF